MAINRYRCTLCGRLLAQRVKHLKPHPDRARDPNPVKEWCTADHQRFYESFPEPRYRRHEPPFIGPGPVPPPVPKDPARTEVLRRGRKRRRALRLAKEKLRGQRFTVTRIHVVRCESGELDTRGLIGLERLGANGWMVTSASPILHDNTLTMILYTMMREIQVDLTAVVPLLLVELGLDAHEQASALRLQESEQLDEDPPPRPREAMVADAWREAFITPDGLVGDDLESELELLWLALSGADTRAWDSSVGLWFENKPHQVAYRLLSMLTRARHERPADGEE